MIKIIAIETDKGVFLCDENQKKAATWSSDKFSYLMRYFFDGAQPEKTFSELWVKVAKIPLKLEVKKPASRINMRYEIKDESLACDSRPLSFPYSESEDYYNVIGLYELKYDLQGETMEEVAFECQTILKIENFKDYGKFSFPYYRNGDFGADSDKNLVINNSGVQYQELDKIIFPEILLPSCPQKISSDAAYGIIRKHIKENINPKHARITSDYDFCFTVKKVVPLANPYTRSIEKFTPSGRRYKRPQFSQHLVSQKEYPIFEITPASQKYKGYPICPEFSGSDQEELENNINQYLKELMETINAPFCECKNCGGSGFTLEQKTKP